MSDSRIIKLVDEANRLKHSRRGLLKRASALGLSLPAVAVAADRVGAAPAPRQFGSAPAQLEGTELSFLGLSYFVPEAEEFFTQQTEQWAADNNVTFSVDYVAYPDLQPKIGANIESKSGADIFELYDTWQYLYVNGMVEVNDMANAIGEAQGGYFDWVTDTASVDGTWYSIPHGNSSGAMAYRMSYFEQAGATEFPQTWEELFAVGKNLKEMGKPLGQAFGHSIGDPPGFAYSYMWAYGAMEVEEDGSTVAFNKPEFVDGMNVFIQGWKDAYDETGLSWDDATNNRAYLSDQISGTFNGSSIYLAALKPVEEDGNPEIAADTNHGDYPAGPAGRFNNLGSRSMAIASYSENIEGAKAFLEWWFSEENFTAWLEANKGYIISPVQTYNELPFYTDDPKLVPYVNVASYARNKGYAGPANQAAASSFARYIVVDTFARAIQNGDGAEAVQWGADQLQRIYNR